MSGFYYCHRTTHVALTNFKIPLENEETEISLPLK